MYGAALFRFRESDFKETRHYGGVSPAWPFGYETLAPIMMKRKSFTMFARTAGCRSTEPPASKGYPLPPLTYEPPDRRPGGKNEAAWIKTFSAANGYPPSARLYPTESPLSSKLRWISGSDR